MPSLPTYWDCFVLRIYGLMLCFVPCPRYLPVRLAFLLYLWSNTYLCSMYSQYSLPHPGSVLDLWSIALLWLHVFAIHQ